MWAVYCATNANDSEHDRKVASFKDALQAESHARLLNAEAARQSRSGRWPFYFVLGDHTEERSPERFVKLPVLYVEPEPTLWVVPLVRVHSPRKLKHSSKGS